VTDTGIGVALKSSPRSSMPDRAIRRCPGDGGTGLGLAFSSQLVRLMTDESAASREGQFR
jgi:signal transduction histidine kinase